MRGGEGSGFGSGFSKDGVEDDSSGTLARGASDVDELAVLAGLVEFEKQLFHPPEPDPLVVAGRFGKVDKGVEKLFCFEILIHIIYFLFF